jgi:prophage DNA circulation protein
MTTVNGFGFIGNCKWREVTFLYSTSKTSGARKTALKKFVNTGLQFVEDLGANPRSYNITGLVAALEADDLDLPSRAYDIQYLDKRDILIKALEQEGPGTLVHPMYGTIENLVVTSYSLDEKVTELGIGRIDIDFEVSNIEGQPISDAIGVSNIEADVVKVSIAVELNIIDKFIANVKLLGVYQTAVTKITEMGDKMESAVDFVQKKTDEVTDGIEKISDSIANFQDEIISNVSSVKDLASAVTNVFKTINANIKTATATYDVLKKFFKFGFITDIELIFKTKGVKQQQTNNRTMNNAMNCNALVGAYLAVALKDHKTTDEIDDDIIVLEDQMTAILDAPEVDSDLLIALLDARQNIHVLLNNRKQIISKVITITTTPISARALSYRYYGNSSEGEDIAELNMSNGLFLDGTVKIFSA